MVEPTTEAGAFGYKYIRAYFSSALTSLDADDIEIRNKKNNQLYSVDTVKLSADGTSADITLYGSVQEGNTSFLAPATIYTMEINQNGESATYEFELPDNQSDEIVVAVDVEDSTITVVPSGRSNAGTIDGEYAIGDVYDGNLSELVGRTVNIGTNSDNEIVKISVNDEAVVTGKMTYRQGDKKDIANANVSVLKDSYFEDALTGIKYYFSSTNTSNVNYTQAFKAWNGDQYFKTDINVAGDTIDFNNLPGTHEAGTAAYDYVQLTLNTNGTVAVAMVDPRWTSNILVNDVVGTIVVESEKMTLDVDGYTIVKGGVYVDPEDLEEGDVLYYDTTNKFAEVYNDEVTGTIEKVTSEKVTIDGKKYDWDGAKYYDSSSKAYKTLDGTADNVGAQKYLNSLSTEDDVTIVLNRGGSIAYITGTEEEAESDSKAVYMTNRLGQAYAQDLKHYAKITLSDGTDQSVTVDLSKLTSYAGKDLEDGGAKIDTEVVDKPWKTTLSFDFTVASGKPDYTNAVGSATATDLKDTTKTDGEFPIGELVKVTTNPAGVVVGLEKLGAVGTMTATSKDDDSTRPQLEGTDTTITAGGKVLALSASTNVWVIDKDLKVKKVAFSDFDNKTAQGKANLVSVYADNTKAANIVINNLDGDAYSEATEDYASGIVMDVQMAANGSSNEVAEITIKAADGIDYEFNGTGKKNGTEPANGNYVVLTLDKDTTDLHDKSSIAEFAWTGDSNGDGITDLFTSSLTPGRGSNATTLLPDDGTTLTAQSGALILKRKDENADGKYEYSPIEIGTINAATNKMNIFWHAVDINGIKMAADIIVVEDVANSAEAGVAVLKPITGKLTTTMTIGTWTDNQTGSGATQSTTGKLQIKQTNGTWADVETVNVNPTSGEIKVATEVKPVGGKDYRLLINAATAKFTDAASNTVSTAAASKSALALSTATVPDAKVTTGTVTAFTATAATLTTDSTVTMTQASVDGALDQYGNAYAPAAGITDDNVTANITSNDGTVIKGVAQLNISDAGALTFTVKSLKPGRTIAANDVFTILGCKFTVTATTYVPAAVVTTTSVAAGTATTPVATVNDTVVWTLATAPGAGTVKLQKSTDGTTWSDVTTGVTWSTTGGASQPTDGTFVTGQTSITATLDQTRGTSYRFVATPDDDLIYSEVTSASAMFAYVTTPSNLTLTSIANATGAIVGTIKTNGSTTEVPAGTLKLYKTTETAGTTVTAAIVAAATEVACTDLEFPAAIASTSTLPATAKVTAGSASGNYFLVFEPTAGVYTSATAIYSAIVADS